MSELRNQDIERRTDSYPELLDFYNEFDELAVTPRDRRRYESFLEDLEHNEDDLLDLPWTFNIVTFRNVGGIPMPVPVELTYDDGSTERVTLPAEFWSQNKDRVSKLFVTDLPVVQVEVDPNLQIADAFRSNNIFPQEIEDDRFALTKSTPRRNPMQRQRGESARTESGGVAVSVARVLPAAWWEIVEERESVSPAAVSAELLGHERIADLRDPWNQPVTIELSGTASGTDDPQATEFCRVRSIGPDGKPGTEDDLVWVIFLDGHIGEKEVSGE